MSVESPPRTGPVNIAAHLRTMAEQRPDQVAVWFPAARSRGEQLGYAGITFRELHEESNRLAAGLNAVGIGRGVRTVLMVPPGREFFALTFALFKAGVVPVLVDPGMGVRNLGKCLAEAQPEAFIGVPKAHLARLVCRWARSTLETLVTVGRRAAWGGLTLEKVGAAGDGRPVPLADTRPDELAAILFTSGSTGVPKGAAYTHSIFAAQVDILRDTFGIEPGEIDLCTFPLFALFAPALGMTAIVPRMDPTRPADVDPARIIAAVKHFGATNLFGSPALINRVGRYGEQHRQTLPSLRRVISAGAPVPARALERFATMLSSGVQVYTPYGATEALPVSVIGSDEILSETQRASAAGAGVCVGRPVEGMQVQIIRITDRPIAQWDPEFVLPPGEIGEITVRGPVVTREYYGRPESTALAKIIDPADGGVWHRMGDVGYFDDAGRLWFCGRKAHRVVLEDATLFTVPCEGVFNAHPQVFRTALVGVRQEEGTRPVLCVELEPGAPRAARKPVMRELLRMGEAHPQTRRITTLLYHPSFPVDIRHNSKIFREKLAVWAARKLDR